jgi:hypothetical protein
MMKLRAFSCPNCGGPVPHDPVTESVRCQYCGTLLNLHRSLCPDCGIINQENERFCGQCGAALVRKCPVCNHENWAGNEHCTQCGGTLDLLEIMTHSRVRDTRVRLETQQRQARAIKQQETAQAEARMAYYQELDRQRLDEIADRYTKRRQRERRIAAAVLIIAVLIVFIIIVLALLGNGLGT